MRRRAAQPCRALSLLVRGEAGPASHRVGGGAVVRHRPFPPTVACRGRALRRVTTGSRTARQAAVVLRFAWSRRLPHGGRRQTGGWRIRRLPASRVELGASCRFEWGRLRPQDNMPLAIQHAVTRQGGLVGPVPTDFLIELGGGMKSPHGLYIQPHPGRRASAGALP